MKGVGNINGKTLYERWVVYIGRGTIVFPCQDDRKLKIAKETSNLTKFLSMLKANTWSPSALMKSIASNFFLIGGHFYYQKFW